MPQYFFSNFGIVPKQSGFDCVFEESEYITTLFVSKGEGRKESPRQSRVKKGRQKPSRNPKCIITLKQRCCPMHGSMAMHQVIFLARLSQIRTLQHRHVDLSNGMLQPQKVHPREWVDMPDALSDALLAAAMAP
jgi:hypothetical protein